MTTTTEFPRSPVVYMESVQRELGRSMTTLEAGEIYGAWKRAIPMDEIAATILNRDNAADAGAADGETAGSQGGRNAPAPQPSSAVADFNAEMDARIKSGLCLTCDKPAVKDAMCYGCLLEAGFREDTDEDGIGMAGHVYFEGDALPDYPTGGDR